MRIPLILISFWIFPSIVSSQKLYIVPNFDFQYSGITHVRSSERPESGFRKNMPLINFMSSIDVMYKSKNFVHKLTLENSRFGPSFIITNKFMAPSDLGIIRMSHQSAIQHFILSYNLGMESQKIHNPFGKVRVRYTGSLGVGIGTNRSKRYYDEIEWKIEGGEGFADTYTAYKGNHSRSGLGLFSILNAGFDIMNKNNKKILCFSFFYDKGFTELAKFDIQYIYGLYSNTTKRVDVPDQILRSRGTSYGLKIGVPIKILK